MPGRCCSGFGIGDRWKGLTPLEVLVGLATMNKSNTLNWFGLPFMPLYKNAKGHWKLWCPLLGRDGRCTIYENRPHYPCVDYEAGKDNLCVMTPS